VILVTFTDSDERLRFPDTDAFAAWWRHHTHRGHVINVTRWDGETAPLTADRLELARRRHPSAAHVERSARSVGGGPRHLAPVS
jgi:hypothetical protein